MNPITTSALTLKLRIVTKASLETPQIESFLRLGFSDRSMFNLKETIYDSWGEGRSRGGKPAEWVQYRHNFTLNKEVNLSKESWSKLYELLISLSPTSLSLSFNGLQDAEWTSPKSSLGTLFSESTSLREIDENLLISTRQLSVGELEAAKKASLALLSALESVRVRYPNNG